MQKILSLKDNRVETKQFIVLLLVAFVFSMAVRYIWVDAVAGDAQSIWNGEIMINTNDGYFFAEGARDILAGGHEAHDLSPVEKPLSKLTAFLSEVLPISFETLILWMPAFFGSLLVVPIILIGRIFRQDSVGFVAALLGGIAWSYYNRTMVGYYDTDLLIVVLPTFMIWGVLYALKKGLNRALIIAPIFAILSMYWHPGIVNIVNATFFVTLLYTALFERKNIYYYKFLSVFILSMTTLPIVIKFILVIAMVSVYHMLKERLTERIIIGVVIASTIIYLIFGGMSWILGILGNTYLVRALHAGDLNNLSLHYYGVVNTVREAGHIPFETFANRISGHMVIFWLSVIGYILLVFRHKLLLLTLPMVGLGFFALQGGLRFTVFAVPFMALGIAYLILLLSPIASKLFLDNLDSLKSKFPILNKTNTYLKANGSLVQYGFVAIATIAILYPNIKHVIGYKVPTVMTQDEVTILDKLRKTASREDYVMAWWDYGYAIRYYSDVKTLIDGGKHNGGSNFPTSFALLNNQVAAANMARLDVEYTEMIFDKSCGVATSFECMLKKSNISNPNQFIQSLNQKNIKLPSKTRDVYIYLPNKMMNILPTIDLFSNLNLMTGQQYRRPTFNITRPISNSGGVLRLNNGMEIRGGSIKMSNQTIPLNQLIVTEYDAKGLLHVNSQRIDPGSPLYAIYMKNYNRFLILDKRIFNSMYIQLFVLENYDRELYKAVILNPHAKVYKLKI